MRANSHAVLPRFCLFLLLVFGTLPSLLVAQTSLGPIGGKFRDQGGSNYLKIESLTSNGPGKAAGLQVGDYIYAVFGKNLSVLSTNTANGWRGSVQDFGEAIERAESGNGSLPISVLRPGAGNVNVTVQLPAVGGFGPAYPLGSPKFDAMYQWACEQIHNQVAASGTVGVGYNTGLNGLILLSHPNWNDTTGAKPYRLSINRMKDACVAYLNGIIVDPMEDTNLDGTPNDGSVNDSNPSDQSHIGVGLENWEISTAAMFLAEYRLKTGDIPVDATIQRVADALANRVQDYQQPPYGGSVGPTKVGMMGHGGVTGDYPHIGYSGINIINAHALTAMAMLKGAGAAVNETQFLNCWQRMKETTNDWGGDEDGNVGYAWMQGGGDSTGRTAGAVYGMKRYGGISPGNQTIVDRQMAYMLRQWQRFQHAHAYTVGGVVFYQFAMPYFGDREQRFLMENMKFFYQFHRNDSGTLDYFGGRENNGGDGYLNYNSVAIINTAMAYAVQSGNLMSFPTVNHSRIHADFKSPNLKWPSLAARVGEVNGNSTAFNVDITDYLGTVLNPGDYSATWSHVSGPATATFTSASSASTTVNFPSPGNYRIKLVVTKGGYTLTEPIDLEVYTLNPPAGYTMGLAQYRIYTGITGTAVTDLTSNAKYPGSPDVSGSLSSLEGTYSGDNYGTRIRGFIVPPVTGNYTFNIASDDAGQFKFGTSEGTASVICSNATWVEKNQWARDSSQTSPSQSLTAGVPYFFEVNHKEGSGGDHVAVAWTPPGASSPVVIPGRYLAISSAGSLSIIKQPTNQVVPAGNNVVFNVVAEGAGPFLYQWTLNGEAYWPASSNSTLTLNNVGAGMAGTYICTVLTPTGTIVSNGATLTVSGVGALTPGGLWREVYENIGGGSVADLTSSSMFPKFPNSGGLITETVAPSDYGGNFGERWTGWLKPNLTGLYTFYIASDDSSELWLSTDGQPANKVKIAFMNGYTGEKNWSGGGRSAAINLNAGNRYYIEVRHKEGGGGDHCAVTWRKPGDPAVVNGQGAIPSQFLETLSGGVYEQSVLVSMSLLSPAAESVKIRPDVGLALECAVVPALGTGDIVLWTQESGPGTVTFDAPSSLATGATFSTEGNYILRCTVDNGGAPVTKDVSVQVTAQMTAQWTNYSIAEPTQGSGVVNPNGSVTVRGSGEDIFNLSDQCHLFAQNLKGDFDVRARLISKSLGSNYGVHAALMARETTSPNSRNVALSQEYGVAFQYRATTGQGTSWQSVSWTNYPVWLRLVRSGGNPATGSAGQNFTGYFSTNGGATWTQSRTVTYGSMPETLMVGFAVSSSGSALNTAVFDNISGLEGTEDFGPQVAAGADRVVTAALPTALAGTASDEGLPASPGAMTSTWTRISGPGVVTFGDPSLPATTATFSLPGTYVLRLLASDGKATTFDDVTLTVSPDADANSLDDAWELLHYEAIGSVAAEEDTDHDGYSAFEEMVFGLNPHVSDPASAVVQAQLIDDLGVAKMEFKFSRPQNYAALNVTYKLQVSSDLTDATWTDSTAIPTVTPNGDNEWVTYTLTLPDDSEGRMFYRVKVASAP